MKSIKFSIFMVLTLCLSTNLLANNESRLSADEQQVLSEAYQKMREEITIVQQDHSAGIDNSEYLSNLAAEEMQRAKRDLERAELELANLGSKCNCNCPSQAAVCEAQCSISITSMDGPFSDIIIPEPNQTFDKKALLALFSSSGDLGISTSSNIDASLQAASRFKATSVTDEGIRYEGAGTGEAGTISDTTDFSSFDNEIPVSEREQIPVN
ncbi:MAG: hypothetical protein ABIA04_00870 [Pseudomonadota bacterium]